MDKLIKGVDVSTLLDEEANGALFFDGGVRGDALSILNRHGCGLLRLRVWNDPYSEKGEPYGGGTCDVGRMCELARRGKALGMAILPDLHYSDFWADPGKQFPPKAWAGLDADELAGQVYAFTKEVISRFCAAGAEPFAVATGNELTNGLLWPDGKAPDMMKNAVKYLNAASAAVKESGLPVMIHLDNGGNNGLYRSWFDSYFENGGGDFEYIGMSYYPFWHGTLEDLEHNMHDVALRYGKDIIVAETSTAFTLEPYAELDMRSPCDVRGGIVDEELAAKIPYPATKEGQSLFMRDLTEVIRGVPDGHGKGFIYWEPAWIPVGGCGWATKAGMDYVCEQGFDGNGWANQALFDYSGNALPALYEIEKL